MAGLDDIAGTTWAGKAELWQDPLGDVANVSECTIAVDKDAIRYTWSLDGEAHEGSITLTDAGADYTDSWHQKEPASFKRVSDTKALLCLIGSYEGDWGWRIALCSRTPTGELVLQMTNITPWGEEARAVRMVGARQDT